MRLARALDELIAELDLPHPGAHAVERGAARWALGASDPNPEQMPRALRAGLEAAAELGFDGGLEALLGAAGDTALPGGAHAIVEAAITAPELVVDAARALGRHRWPVWELSGREAARREAAGRAGQGGLSDRLEAAIRPGLEAHRHRSVLVEVREHGPELRLRIASQGPPQRGWGEDVRLLVSDLVVVDWKRGRLRLAVDAGWRRELYRRALGELLHDDPGWYSGPSVTLAPILASTEAALRPTRLVGRAGLVGVEIGGDGPGEGVILYGPRVLADVARLDLGDQLEGLQAVTLDLQLDAREARVELRPPHLIVYDRPREEPAVRAFLAERGLLGGNRTT